MISFTGILLRNINPSDSNVTDLKIDFTRTFGLENAVKVDRFLLDVKFEVPTKKAKKFRLAFTTADKARIMHDFSISVEDWQMPPKMYEYALRSLEALIDLVFSLPSAAS